MGQSKGLREAVARGYRLGQSDNEAGLCRPSLAVEAIEIDFKEEMAAPELLEAMKNALGDLSHIPAECVPDATDRERLITAASGLRAAIAKATT